MAEVIVFPDAEQVIGDWLAARLDALGPAVPVATRPPDPRPAAGFVVLKRTGGSRHTLVTDAALIAVESWADRESDAHDLAQLVRGLLNSAPGQLAGVKKVREASGPGNLPDPVSPQARYTQTFEIHLRGAAA